MVYQIWESDREETQRVPSLEKTFDGVVRRLALRPVYGKLHLVQSLNDQREQIEDILRENVLHEPQRVQYCAEESLDKSKEGEETEYITFYTNSAYIPAVLKQPGVHSRSSPNAEDNLLIGIARYWLEKSSNKLDQHQTGKKTGGSSFIELPRNIRKHKKWLLNIRNTVDHTCFAYCFTAAYHSRFKQKLSSYTQTIGWKKRDDPRVFNPEFDPLAQGPVGDLKPMSINKIPQIEQVTNVSVTMSDPSF